MSNIKPLYDRLVVKPIEAEETSLGGIIIPDAAKEKPTKGEVIAVGEGKFIDATGGVRAPKVKVADIHSDDALPTPSSAAIRGHSRTASTVSPRRAEARAGDRPASSPRRMGKKADRASGGRVRQARQHSRSVAPRP